MDIQTFKSKLQTLQESRNRHLVSHMAALWVAILAILLCFSLLHRERIVIVPPTLNHEEWITERQDSPDYVAEMTRYFALLRFNVTPLSAKSQSETLLLHTDPQFYGDFKALLTSEAEALTRNHMSLAFYPVAVDVKDEGKSAFLTGDLVAWIGNTVLPAKRVRYEIQYRNDEGRLFITAFKEVNAL